MCLHAPRPVAPRQLAQRHGDPRPDQLIDDTCPLPIIVRSDSSVSRIAAWKPDHFGATVAWVDSGFPEPVSRASQSRRQSRYNGQLSGKKGTGSRYHRGSDDVLAVIGNVEWARSNERPTPRGGATVP